MRLLLAALLIATAVPRFAAADPLTPFRPSSNRVVLADVQPRYDRAENRTNEFYSEWWSFVFRLENGYFAYVQFLISNMGPGDGKATVKVEFRTPDGTKYNTNTDLDDGDWSWAKDRFELRFGDNLLYGPVDGLRIRLKNRKLTAEFALENLAPPWKPGTAHAQYGNSKDRYYAFHYMAPIARVKGTVRLAGEETDHAVAGLVHADHSVSSIGPHEMTRTMARFRALDEKTTLLLTDIRTPTLYGGAPIRFAVLFHDGQPVIESTDFEIGLADPYPDPEREGYFAPRMLEIKGTTAKGTFRGAIQATKMTKREDFLESSGKVARFVISRFAKPVMYYFNGVYAFQVQQGGETREFKGRGNYYYTVVNP